MVLIYNIGSGTEDHTWAATLIKALVCVSLPQCIKSTGVLDTGCAVSKRCTFVADLSQSQSMKHFVNMLRMPTAAQTSVRIIGTEDCSNLVCSKCNMVVEVHQTFCVHVQNAYDSSDECQNHWNWRLLKSCVLKMLHDCRSTWNILCTAQVQNTFDSSEKCQCHLNYCCLSAYQPSCLTAIPNHLTSFGESWNPQTNTILTAETAQSTELVKRTCQACVQWKCTHPLTTEFCWYLTTVARIIPGAFLSSYIMRLWTVAETKGWLPAKAAAQSVPMMDDTHMFSLPFDCSKVWVNWQLWEMKQSASLCGGNVTLCIPNTASPAGFDRMKATNFHFPADLSLTQWLPIMLAQDLTDSLLTQDLSHSLLAQDLSHSLNPGPVPLPLNPGPVPLPLNPGLVPLPVSLRPVPLPLNPGPVPLPLNPGLVPLPVSLRPVPLPLNPQPVPFPISPRPVPLLAQAWPLPLPIRQGPVPLHVIPGHVPLPVSPRTVPSPARPRPVPLPLAQDLSHSLLTHNLSHSFTMEESIFYVCSHRGDRQKRPNFFLY